MLVLTPTQLFTGAEFIEGASVHMHDGRIVDITRTAPAGALELKGVLAPGFIDAQINGGGGILFNDAPTPDALAMIAQAHHQFGVTGFMATLISDEPNKIAASFDAVEAAVLAGLEGVLGLHLEGPWLSEPRRGVHPSRHLRDFHEDELQLLARKRCFPLLVTLAPERISQERINALADAGLIISLGHTAASSEEIDAALVAGAVGFTHVFNAMPPMEGRKPGAVGAALTHKEAWAGLILDGIHVHPVSARVAFACKTAQKLMLISDAMATVGTANDSMALFGETIGLVGGALRTASGTLAGAHLDMSQAVRNAVTLLGATTSEALRMASLTPAEFLRVDHERGRIAPRFRADLVLLDSTLKVSATWIGGKQVH
ncbi:MAG: N-acetylglucosamine-6-phosphate deacetylase [Terricaulis sp.]